MKTLGTTPDLWILPEGALHLRTGLRNKIRTNNHMLLGVKIYLTAVRKENSVYFLKVRALCVSLFNACLPCLS
jgi:hypothetical protein